MVTEELIIKCLVCFIVGAIIGAASALLLAPSSGQELRTRLSQEMAAKRQQLRADLEADSETVERGAES
jgi:gas vesicle protein